MSGLLHAAMQELYPLEKNELKRLLSSRENLYNADKLQTEFGLPSGSISQKNKLIIKGEPHKIPYIMLLLNTLINYIPFLKQINGDHILKILCSFAKLGPEARQYLCSCLVLGSLLELNNSFRPKCTDLIEKGLVRFELVDIPTIGTIKNESTVNIRRMPDDKLKAQYLLELAYLLIRSTQISLFKNVPSEEDLPLKNKFIDLEENYIWELRILGTFEIYVNICQENKVALTYFGKILSYLSKTNDEFTLATYKNISKKLDEVECNRTRLYLRLAKFMLSNTEKYALTMQVSFINFYGKLFKDNVNVYRITECLIDYLIKICRTNPSFLSQVRKEGLNLVKKMDDWLRSNPYPSINFDVKNIYYALGVNF